MRSFHRLDLLAGALVALARSLPCSALGLRWFPAASGLLLWPSVTLRGARSLRIGAYRCRWAAAPKHDWRSWNPERQTGDAVPDYERYHSRLAAPRPAR